MSKVKSKAIPKTLRDRLSKDSVIILKVIQDLTDVHWSTVLDHSIKLLIEYYPDIESVLLEAKQEEG
jgi:hypothetical protein